MDVGECSVHLSHLNHRITLAEAHCKLCLRTTVGEEDALVAVLLCENSISLQHGTTCGPAQRCVVEPGGDISCPTVSCDFVIMDYPITPFYNLGLNSREHCRIMIQFKVP